MHFYFALIRLVQLTLKNKDKTIFKMKLIMKTLLSAFCVKILIPSTVLTFHVLF